MLERDRDFLLLRSRAEASRAVGECVVLVDGDDLAAVEAAWPNDGVYHGINFLGVIGSIKGVVDDLCESFEESDEWRKCDGDDPVDSEIKSWIVEPEHMLAWAEHLELQAARIRDAVTAKALEQG